MPRRSRGHTYRKRTAPPEPERLRGRSLPAPDAGEATDVDAQVVETATRPASSYIRARGAVPSSATPAPRASRAFITDYSYVVSEMKRIGFTFGGLIVLLVVISRMLQ